MARSYPIPPPPAPAPQAAPPAVPGRSFANGSYEVGRDIQPGTYRSPYHMLFPGFGVRPQSLRGSEGFGVLCVRLASSQPDADGPANALTGA